MKPEALRTRRADLSAAYAKARKRHSGQALAAERLRVATTALLKAELSSRKPKRGRPPLPRPSNPDLFFSEARP